MSSLTAHLLEAGDHGRLGFHPSCPVCRRERLFGSLSSEPVVSRRVQAALATGVLALSTVAPGAAAASDPDRQRQRIAAPDQRPGQGTGRPSGGGADDPDFDPGGETALPFDIGPEQPTPTEDDPLTDEVAPVEAEPVDDPDGRVLSPDEPASQTPPADDAPVPPVEAAPVTPTERAKPARPAPLEPAPVIPPIPPAEDQATAPQHEAEQTPVRNENSRRAKRERPAKRTTGGIRDESTSAGPQSAPPAPPVDVAPAVDVTDRSAPAAPLGTVPTRSQPAVVAQAGAPERDRAPAATNARFHVVRSGESLWAIARTLLGPSASPAQIAREVDRLWRLNEDRIGTGNRDLLMVGTKLRL
jgi:nucleoid-associated protein YgaU